MSLYERQYMKDPGFHRSPSLTVVLIIINVIVFIFQSISLYYGLFPIKKYFYLNIAGISSGYIWQLLTYQFLHGDLFHILINCVVLYFFGRAVEEYLGKIAFLKIYFISGILGGILQLLYIKIFVSPELAMTVNVVGASAGVFGLIAAFATLFPEQQLTTFIALLIPITMRAKFLLLIEILITLYGLIFPVSVVAHAAHLGGIIFGVFYIRWGIRLESYIRSLKHKKIYKKPSYITVPETKTIKWEIDDSIEDDDLPPDEFIKREVDPILDKIAQHGIQSLTDRERKILEKARQRMERR